ncbi:MAG: DedA family protein [Saprospiraceae bacterium]|nr:DedA family protein [Saprospiraceae bacterium]
MSLHWTDLLQPQWYINNGGLFLLLFVVFAETGLFAGFFLPGDSLLFVAGIYSNKLAAWLYDWNNDFLNLIMIVFLVTICGIAGNIVGYWFGEKSGPALYNRKDSFFFKQKYLRQASDFYEENGGFTIIVARFVPFVRTFAPIVAGIVKMDYKKFMWYNVTGCFAWSLSMLGSGHYLHKFFLNRYQFDLTLHLEVIVLLIVFVTTLPVFYKLIKNKLKHRHE